MTCLTVDEFVPIKWFVREGRSVRIDEVGREFPLSDERDAISLLQQGGIVDE